MKRFIPIILALSLFLSSCGALGASTPAETTPTLSADDIRATANVLVYDMMTQTAAAMPTNTPIPPTETSLPPTATATLTLVPTTVVDGVTPTALIPTAAALPTSTTAATYACTEKPLTGWTGDSVTMKITNNVPNSTANVFLCITTPYGETGYISVPVTQGSTVSVPRGLYSATAWVSGKRDFNAYIAFEIKQVSGVQLIIEDGKLRFASICTPNC